MSALPRISIVTPSYNQASYIGLTVRSVLLQGYPDLEYIVMDGGSTDGTQEVLEPYVDQFAHYVSERDNGQSDALNKGFSRTTGEILAYLNSDDLLAPGALDFVAQYFADRPDVDVVYSHRVTVDEHNKAASYWILPPHSTYLMSRWDLIPQETCFWRRRIFERSGNVDPSYRFAMDYALFARFMVLGGRFVRVPRFLGAFRYHSQAKTSQLLETIGQKEIHRVRQENGIRLRHREYLVGGCFSMYVQRRGMQWAIGGRVLPGALPGVGYDYDEVWGGMLKDARLPPRVGQGQGPIKPALV